MQQNQKHTTWLRWVGLACLTAFTLNLAGCDWFKDKGDSKSSKAKPGISSDKSLDNLMKAVFPKWKPQATMTMALTNAVENTKDEFEIHPTQVVELSPEEIVLIVQGDLISSNIVGEEQINQMAKGNSGAYWFQKQDEHWKLTKRNDSFSQVGSKGAATPIKVIQLGEKVTGLVQDTTDCRSGDCYSSLSFFQIGANGYLKTVTPVIASGNENSGAALPECEGWLKSAHPPKNFQIDVDFDNFMGCKDISSTWSIVTNKNEPYGNLVMSFQENVIYLEQSCPSKNSKTTTQSEGQVAPAASSAASGAASIPSTPTATATSDDDSICTNYLLHPVHRKITVVYKFVNNKWVMIKGENPLARDENSEV